jgi:hypothetical protein
MSGIDPTDEPTSFLEDLRQSEIIFNIGWVFDRCWTVTIGQASNRAEGICESLGEVAKWLPAKAIELYPDSEFAKHAFLVDSH